MDNSQKQKHVIILGAGASVTSGYPDAKRLRLLLLSETKVQEELVRRGEDLKKLDTSLPPMFLQDGGITRLFREGGFATVDEFSSLAQSRFPNEIAHLKWRLRWALSLHNPEKHFEDSDYYAFIQKLFQNQIFPLRNDVAILTFNYDPYLAFLLKRAAKVRYEAAGQKAIGGSDYTLTSGFEGRNLDALESGDELCLLHLHGMIAWPIGYDHQKSVTFDDLFYDDTQRRFEKLHYRRDPVPIIFPWEVFNENGGFCTKKDFCLREERDEKCSLLGGYSGQNDLHDLFVSIWKRAQKEIRSATKISFVGLSMHEFLRPAFQFLFSGKKSQTNFVIANKDTERKGEAFGNPRTSAYKTWRMITEAWPACRDVLGGERPAIPLYETFAEFIQHEMD